MAGPGQLRRQYKRASRDQQSHTTTRTSVHTAPDMDLIQARIHDLAVAALMDAALEQIRSQR